jgi:hypothetical protein
MALADSAVVASTPSPPQPFDAATKARDLLEKIRARGDQIGLQVAEIAVIEGMIDAGTLWDMRMPPPAPAPLRPLLAANDDPNRVTVIDAVESYVTARDVRLSETSKRHARAYARLFADHFGRDRSIYEVTGSDVTKFTDRLLVISPRYARDPNVTTLSLAEIEAKHPAGDGQGLTVKTINSRISPLRQTIKRMQRRGEWAEDRKNPFDDKSLPKPKNAPSTKYLPATEAELVALLKDAPLAKKKAKNFKDALGWFIALGIYEGLRESEIAALSKPCIKREGQIDFIDVPGTKTDNAPRRIPIHSAIKKPFLAYVEACGDGKLFGVTAATIAKRFPEYRDKHGVTRPRVVFHSTRKCFTEKLEHADVDSNIAAVLDGHARGFTYQEYSPHGPKLRQLATAVEKVKYGSRVRLRSV